MTSRIFFPLFFLIFGSLQAEYIRNSHVDEHTWNTLKPYFLPEEKTVKKKLDIIFSKYARPTASTQALFDAGFTMAPVQGIRVKVVKHHDMPGYVFKVLTDDQDGRPDTISWLNRVKGAHTIRQAISELKLEHFFFVPDKWIYPLPDEPGPVQAREGGRINFILVAKNAHPQPREVNLKLWHQLANKKVLDGLYAILMKTGAADSIKENNIPWCKNGKIGFVDTEHTHDWDNIRFYRLERILSTKMKQYWYGLYH